MTPDDLLEARYNQSSCIWEIEMYISDKKSLNKEYFEHAAALKDRFQYSRVQDEKRLRAFHEHDRLMEDRKLAAEEHEVVRKQNEAAMDKEVDKKMAFIKKSLSLNII